MVEGIVLYKHRDEELRMFYEIIKEVCFALVVGAIGGLSCVLIGIKIGDYLYEKEKKKKKDK